MESEEQRNRKLGLRGINMPLLYFASFGSSAVIVGFFVWLVLQDPNLGAYPLIKWINLVVVIFMVGPVIAYGLIRHAEEEDHKYDPFGYTFPAMPPVLKVIAYVWFVLAAAGFMYLKAQS